MDESELSLAIESTGDKDNPGFTIRNLDGASHKTTRWFASGFTAITEQTGASYGSKTEHIQHVLGGLPAVEKLIDSLINQCSGQNMVPCQVHKVSLSVVEQKDGRILVFAGVVAKEMKHLTPKQRKAWRKAHGYEEPS